MMTYDEIFPIMLRHEIDPKGNGYVVDSGGPTQDGVTQSTYNDYRYSLDKPKQDVRLMSANERSEIYKQRYWNDGSCNIIPAIIQLTHFDFCVNAGTYRAKIVLQSIAGVQRDGVIGPKTLHALSQIEKYDLLDYYTNGRLSYYNGLVTRNPTKYRQYIKSWTARTEDCKRRTLTSYGTRDSNPGPCEVPKSS